MKKAEFFGGVGEAKQWLKEARKAAKEEDPAEE